MASSTVYMRDLAPFTPDIDPRKWTKTGVLNGQNFLFDVDGPRSAFGSRFADYNFWPNLSKYKLVDLPIGDEYFYGTPEGVFRINDISKLPEPILTVPVTNKHWPWTVALVGNLYYFAQYNAGLWQYNEDTNSIRKVSTPVGDNVIGVTESYGRLIALNAELYMWSALDDGTDFFPSLLTGAGAQATSLLGGMPYRVDPVTDGFMVATSKGIIKATKVDAQFIWQHDVLSRDVRIFSPNAGIVIPDIGTIYVDASGFHATAGATPTPWEPDMGIYLKDTFIATENRKRLGILGMYFSQAARMLFVYFSANEQEGLMQQTFVYYLASGKWGTFDHAHYGFLETFDPIQNVSTCSYMGKDGYVRALQNTPWSDIAPGGYAVLSDYVFRPQAEPSVLFNFGPSGTVVLLGFSEFEYLDGDPTDFMPLQAPKIAAEINNEVSPYQLPRSGLNSVIDIGLFRFAAQQEADETSMISTLSIGCSRSLAGFEHNDLNTETGAEDYQSGSGSEDFGQYLALPNYFKLELLDTNDGDNEPPQGWQILHAIAVRGAAIQYDASQGISSIFHRLRFTAEDVGESIALKTIDLAGMLTGRLF